MINTCPLEKITCLLHQLKKEFSETDIHLNVEVLSGERIITEGLIDIALIKKVSQVERIDYSEIGSISMPVLISKNHPVCKLTKVTEKDLINYPQLI